MSATCSPKLDRAIAKCQKHEMKVDGLRRWKESIHVSSSSSLREYYRVEKMLSKAKHRLAYWEYERDEIQKVVDRLPK